MITHSRSFGRLDVFTCTCRDSNMFRDTKLKVTFGFTIISSIAATTLNYCLACRKHTNNAGSRKTKMINAAFRSKSKYSISNNEIDRN